MNGEAGKGDKIRLGANLKAYWDNYDNIFKKDKPKQQNETLQQATSGKP